MIQFDPLTANRLIHYADTHEMPRPLTGTIDEIATWLYRRLPVEVVLDIVCGGEI